MLLLSPPLWRRRHHHVPVWEIFLHVDSVDSPATTQQLTAAPERSQHNLKKKKVYKDSHLNRKSQLFFFCAVIAIPIGLIVQNSTEAIKTELPDGG